MIIKMMFALMDADGDGKPRYRSFRLLKSASSRRWMPTRMASLPCRKCRTLCAAPARHRSNRVTTGPHCLCGLFPLPEIHHCGQSPGVPRHRGVTRLRLFYYLIGIVSGALNGRRCTQLRAV